MEQWQKKKEKEKKPLRLDEIERDQRARNQGGQIYQGKKGEWVQKKQKGEELGEENEKKIRSK